MQRNYTETVRRMTDRVKSQSTGSESGDQQWGEGAVAIAGNVRNHLPGVGGRRLLAAPVASVWELVLAFRGLVSPLPVQIVHLCAQRALRQRLGQIGKYARPAEEVAGRTAFHQPVEQVLLDAHTRVSTSGGYHARARNSAQSRTHQKTLTAGVSVGKLNSKLGLVQGVRWC